MSSLSFDVSLTSDSTPGLDDLQEPSSGHTDDLSIQIVSSRILSPKKPFIDPKPEITFSSTKIEPIKEEASSFNKPLVVSDLESMIAELEQMAQKNMPEGGEFSERALSQSIGLLATDQVQVEVNPHFSSKDIREIIKNLHFYQTLPQERVGNNIYTLVKMLKKIEDCSKVGKPLLDCIAVSNKKISFVLTYRPVFSFYFKENKEGVLNLNFQKAPFYIHEEQEGRYTLGQMPDDVQLYHELVHALNWTLDAEAYTKAVMDTATLKQSNVLSESFTNLEEYRTITGREIVLDKNGQIVGVREKPFSENSYRRFRAEDSTYYPRASHEGLAVSEMSSTVTAVKRIINRQEVQRSEVELTLIKLIENGLSKDLHRILSTENFLQKYKIPNHVFVTLLIQIMKNKKAKNLPKDVSFQMFCDIVHFLKKNHPAFDKFLLHNKSFNREINKKENKIFLTKIQGKLSTNNKHGMMTFVVLMCFVLLSMKVMNITK